MNPNTPIKKSSIGRDKELDSSPVLKRKRERWMIKYELLQTLMGTFPFLGRTGVSFECPLLTNDNK